MPTEDLQSTSIAAREAFRTGSSTTPGSRLLHKGAIRESIAEFEFAVKSVASTYRICEVPASARITQITVKCDAVIVAATIDIGVWATVANGGAAIAATCYASGYDIGAAGLIDQVEINLKWQNLDFGANYEHAVWQDAGLSAAPQSGTMYDIVARTAVATTTGGSVAFTIRWVEVS